MTGPVAENETLQPPSRSSLRKTFIACLVTAAFFTYVYIGNLQVLLNSRYFAEVGIPGLWVSDEGRYYFHMIAINGVILGVIVFLWVWRGMTGKRFIVMLLFFNFAALAAGYTTLNGKSFTATNEMMKTAATELALAARRFPSSKPNRYPRSVEELKRVYRIPPSPYSYRGQGRPLKIVVIDNAAGPSKELARRGDQAGTIYYAVDPRGQHFWITYLEYDFARGVSVFGTSDEDGEVIVLTEVE